MEVLGNIAYLCGYTSTNLAFIGWIDLTSIGSNDFFHIDTLVGNSYSMNSIENIVVYDDALGNHYVAGYGIAPSGYYGLGYNVSTQQDCIGTLPYIPHDVTVTNNYVVYTGTVSGTDIVIHPIPKTNTFFNSYLPYYLYTVGSAITTEPFLRLHITNISGDKIATISYRLDGTWYGLALREYDASGAFTNYDVPMLSSNVVKLNYSATNIYDLQYDAPSNTYAVFHNYAVNPSVYRNAVTKMDFSSGVPSSVSSDYLAISNHTTASMALSDSSMYVVYGYNMTSKEHTFWKEHLPSSTTGTCLNSDILNVISTIHTIAGARHDLYYGIPYNWTGFPLTINSNGFSGTIATLCH